MARVPSDVFGLVGTTVVGAFQVEAVVAEGGFAVVYRAYHSGFRAPVALKCLKIPQYLSDDDQLRFERQFQEEAELLFKLSALTPTVVRPLHVEAVEAPDGSFMPFLALEWLEGETLDSIIERRREGGWPPFTLDEIIDLLEPVALTLDRAHHFDGPAGQISIVHRDMKPENIFVATVGGESVVKILDFGIGKAKSVASQVAGRHSQSEGELTSFTPAYGAPEQWNPKRYGQTGPWTDVWGMALSMVELLVGRPVIDGDQAAMMGTVLDSERRPTPRSEGASIGDAVESVFEKALAVDPRDRFADAGGFWRALLEARVVDVKRQSGWSKASGAAPGQPGLEFDMAELASAGASGANRSSIGAPPAATFTEAPSLSKDRWEASLRALERSPARALDSERVAALHGSLSSGSAKALRPYAIPVSLVAAGILMTIGDSAYAAWKGEVFALGPLRIGWFAAAAVLGGIGLAVRRFLAQSVE